MATVASPFNAFLEGRQARQQQEQTQQKNALLQMQVQNAPYEQQRQNRLLDLQTQGAEQDIQYKNAQMSGLADQKKLGAIKQLGSLAQQAIASPNPRGFVQQAVANPAYAQLFKEAGMDTAKLDLNSPSFDQDIQTWASFGEQPTANDRFNASEKAKDRALTVQQNQLNRENQFNIAKDKAPAGYRSNPDGTLAPISGGPADPATKNQLLKPIPTPIAQAIIANRQEISKLDRALAGLKENPDAFGLKNYTPDMILQRLPGKGQSGGVDARAKVADIGSLIIHDRSGAAVTVSEYPRLRPFVPQAADSPATVKTKLDNLRLTMQSMQDELEGSFTPETGYRPISQTPGRGASGSWAGGAPASALEYLKANPQFKGAFRQKYGYLP